MFIWWLQRKALLVYQLSDIKNIPGSPVMSYKACARPPSGVKDPHSSFQLLESGTWTLLIVTGILQGKLVVPETPPVSLPPSLPQDSCSSPLSLFLFNSKGHGSNL